jgi:CRISPR-associated protein Csm1
VYLYRLNDTDCLPPRDAVDGDCAYGFRFLANVTPRIGVEEDRKRLQSFLDPEEGKIRPGDIRSTTIMARWDRTGIDRYGVLRMDVDDLGTLFARRLVVPSLLHTSALSAALGLFFEGWLNRLCENAAHEWQQRVAEVTADSDVYLRVKLPYVIYAGGDDLLIVGPWDVLPVVAWHIRRDLGSYVARGYVDPHAAMEETPITVSAGIFAETAKFPLYQAAEQAGEALDAAKRHKVWRREERKWETVKDAITFLDTTLGWDEFREAETLALKLAWLVDVGIPRNGGPPDKAPHALIHLLAAVAKEYAEQGGEETPERLPYGRWMPLLAYGLRRMVDRAPATNLALRQELMALADRTLDLTRVADAARWPTIRFLGMPVRWAEFLIRKGG